MTIGERKALLDRPGQDEEALAGSDKLPIGKLTMGALLLACFLANADETFVLSTGSDVASALNASSSASWLITAYNLGYTVGLPVYGQICESTGPKGAVLLALALYAAGCILTGVSGTINYAIAGRVITGFGGSGMNELVSVLLNNIDDFHRVAMLRSYVTTVSLVGITCGAPIGALLTSQIGWQLAFIIHVPFALLCIAIISLKLHIDKPRSLITTDPKYGTIEETIEETKIQESGSKSKPFDIVGLGLLITAIVCLLCFVQLAEAQGMQNQVMVLAILGGTFIICSVIFCVNEAYWTRDPLLPLCLLRISKLGLNYGAQFFIGLASYAMTPMFSDYWVNTRGVSAEEGAMCWGPVTLGFAFSALVTGKLIQSTHIYLRWSVIGLAISIFGFLLILVRWTVYQPHMWEISYGFLAWLGMGMTLSSQFVALSASKPEQNAATSVTTYYLVQQVGFMMGITLSKALISREIEHRLMFALRDESGRNEVSIDAMSRSYVVTHILTCW
ncbi:uncharacterized protein N7496_002248 [Penicillium cataractarum]|uniref:Major facilitator superfamily (MFS) profile domain-containing protein n=1 Tax=Penicillium cataractarum TaxID=2100454 RepID=A0A9W9SK06_9EURO|nr:uncharacterized protein N7496_002248 [Penicillium cataractarum]KAJ5379820.1 hypothetical protein N7496_002248 [Penicillium cataractarum]